MTPPMTPHATAGQPAVSEQNPALVRGLKIAVIGMGIMILAGLAAVVWRITHLASSPKDAGPGVVQAQAIVPSPLAPDIMLALPDGAAVRSVTLGGNRLAVHYDAPAGSGIAVLDLESGRTLTHVRFGGTHP